MTVSATCLGFPRIGPNRELKKALEGYWSGKISAEALEQTAREIKARNWRLMRDHGIDAVPCNDFSLYDHVLDTAVCFGAVPDLYRSIADPLTRYFAMARGYQDRGRALDVPALEMTKWFDTNYHYIVPELTPSMGFALDATKLREELEEAAALGISPRPVVPGPVTFLRLSRFAPGTPEGTGISQLLPALLDRYEELFAALAAAHVNWLQLDEPYLVLDLDTETKQAYRVAFERLSLARPRPKILLTTYFGSIVQALDLIARSGFEGLHVDLARAPEQLEAVLGATPSSTTLSLGLVDGRNIWRADLDAAHALLRRVLRARGEPNVLVAPSCSLLHVPVDLDAEQEMDAELKGWMAFATQKLGEVQALAETASIDNPQGACFDLARRARATRESSPRITDPAVRERMRAAADLPLTRRSPHVGRAAAQQARFGLPLLPTTTIGSFPQTREVRRARAARRNGRIDDETYNRFIEQEIQRCVALQEAVGLDVLVHGEPERSDMVAYFGEQLNGFAFSENGWVQSYGSRCVKPPVIFGDVSRPRPMTVFWSRFAQSLTDKPMKAMLTGPVTMLQWSFVRDDQPREDTCRQLALALRDEVKDLEVAGIHMIQVDEPAVREGLPLRRADWEGYLSWAVDAFRLATSGVADQTQIHTHMCYAEFADILDAIIRMDADVISLETSRSKMAHLDAFSEVDYPNQIGPGVYDIHSPRIPSQEEMVDLLTAAAEALPVERLWVNPDCGLKTRGWEEVAAALTNMVGAAAALRARLAPARPPGAGGSISPPS